MSERFNHDASDHPSETLFNDDFINTAPVPVYETAAQPVVEAAAPLRTRRTARMARHATLGEVRPEGRAPKSALGLAHTLRMEAISEDGDDATYRHVSEAYGELGGGLQKEYITSPNTLLRKMELCATLETYRDWYKEFDAFASSGVFEAGHAYRTMDSGQRHAYFLHLFDIIDTATNRIGLIRREENPSVSPTIEEAYGKKTDQELKEYATQLTRLRSHAYETQVVHTMFNEFDINVDEHGAPYMSTWLLQKIRKQVQSSKSRTRSDRRHVTFTSRGMTYKSSRNA